MLFAIDDAIKGPCLIQASNDYLFPSINRAWPNFLRSPFLNIVTSYNMAATQQENCDLRIEEDPDVHDTEFITMACGHKREQIRAARSLDERLKLDETPRSAQMCAYCQSRREPFGELLPHLKA